MTINLKKKMIVLWTAVAVCMLLLQGCGTGKMKESGFAASNQTGESGEAGAAENTGKASKKKSSKEKDSKEKDSKKAAESTASPASVEVNEAEGEAKEASEPKLSPEMNALKEQIEKEFAEKDGRWSMYLCRLDTGEEFGVNAQDSMISASLIKLFIAGCYFDQIEQGKIADDYPNQLYTMISESNNGSTNTLIDVLGMDTINEFIRAYGFEGSWLKRKMLEKNGQENYTTSEDCGHVLKEVYEGTYVNEEASERIMEALRGQISRNREKIPAGVPEGVETANKTGELFTNDENGVAVNVQNDAAIIFQSGHPYILVVMTTVPSVGEGEMHRRIAELSTEVYTTVCSGDSDGIVTAEDGHEVSTGSTAAEADEKSGSGDSKDSKKSGSGESKDSKKSGSGVSKDSKKSDSTGEGSKKSGSAASEDVKKSGEAVNEVTGVDDDAEVVREDAAVSLPIEADQDGNHSEK